MQAFRLSDRVIPVRGAQVRAQRAGPRAVPNHGPPDAATSVPWRVARHPRSGVVELELVGDRPVRAMRLSLAGGGMLGLTLPRTVHPGERIRVVLRGVYVDGAVAAPDALLVARWFDADGRELLWPIAL